MLWRDLTQVTHIKLSLFSRQQHTLVSADSYTSCSSPLFHSTLLSLPLSLPLSVTCCGFLEYILVYSTRCSASQLLLALAQTATNW
ncbi:unnamed protein product [Hymenolepis diminuta]|uniref:Uncharacterized protein n=1 Tax=Hymenolepis diminuta TaxID=6216 RepID=A0A564XVF6_HYMDI|nr:unnamed protein product [Hymenolepis diminuta]